MRPKYKGLSSYFKFFVAFTLVTIIVIVDYYSFHNRLKRIELYSALDSSLNSIIRSSISLRHNLDMLVLVRRFEGSAAVLIKKDVGMLDANIAEVTESAGYFDIISKDKLFSEGLVSIAELWYKTRNEIASMNRVSTEQELLLMHNAVGTNAVLINEVSDRLLLLLGKGRAEAIGDLKLQIIASFVGFLAMLLVTFLVFYRRYLSPLWDAASTAERIALGEAGGVIEKFRGRGGYYMTRLTESLNGMFTALALKNALWNKKYRKLVEEGDIKDGQIEVLGILNGLAGSTLCWADLFERSVDEAVSRGGVDAAGVYILEHGSLKLKASAGFDASVTDYGVPIEPLSTGQDGGVAIFDPIGEYPDARYAALLKSCGFSELLSVPILCGERVTGYLHACFNGGGAALAAPFLGAIASNMGAFAVYLEILHGEQDRKKSLERIMNQVPLGIALFDVDGLCRRVNVPLRRLLGVPAKVELVGEFNIFEDDVLIAQSMIPTIKKSYEGFVTKFIINYNPASLKRYDFPDSPMEIKINSIPFYDAGGEISSIMLLYEDLTDSPVQAGPHSGAVDGKR